MLRGQVSITSMAKARAMQASASLLQNKRGFKGLREMGFLQGRAFCCSASNPSPNHRAQPQQQQQQQQQQRQQALQSTFKAGRNVKMTRQTIVPDPDYRVPIILLGGAAALVYVDNLFAAAPVGLLGLLLLFQTTRVRFVFDDEALEVKVGEELKESGENVFVGGKNRWKYSTFVNWELWWPNFPVLVYFKETQTKPEGQVHFFPVIFNGKQLYDVMVERAGPSQNSAPK